MPLEVAVRFRCNTCPTTFEVARSIHPVPGFPLDAKTTIGAVPPGWRCYGEVTACPTCAEKRVVVAPAGTLHALDAKRNSSH